LTGSGRLRRPLPVNFRKPLKWLFWNHRLVVRDGGAVFAFSCLQTVEAGMHREATMFHIDPNINTAVEQKAERLRALRGDDFSRVPERFAPDWAVEESGPSNWIRRGATLLLAAAVPIVLIVVVAVVLMVR
jgi:hypothetical protein